MHPTFVKIDNVLYSTTLISFVDCIDIEDLIVRVVFHDGHSKQVIGLEAIDLIMSIKPSMVEGKRFKFKKFMWIVHNLIGHPLMQLFAILRMYKTAIWIHEKTVPRPRNAFQE